MGFVNSENRLTTKVRDFVSIRANNLIYVDKTSYIQKIAESRAPVLLARPDGFGKTTIVSTLEELFKHGIKPYDDHDSFFKGLDIEKTWNDTGTYHVLRLDFSDDFSPSYDPNTLETVLINKIKKSALVLL